MNLDQIISIDKQCYLNTFGNRNPVCFERGQGIYLYATDGTQYVDFMGGIAVNALGHSHPTLTAALHEQVDKLLHVSNLYYNEPQTRLAEKLTEVSCADKVFFANSGAEANEGAIKLARVYFYRKGQEHKNEIITLNRSFHGRTLATVAATAQEHYQQPYRPLLHKFVHVEANDKAALEQAVNENTCAILLEVIQGESGVHPLTKEYLQYARKLCDENDILLIFDEVQTGMGRTGHLFAYQLQGVEPDIFTLAKALGGGIPIGAVCAKDSVSAFEPGDHGSTFGGNPFACRAGLAVFQALEEQNLVEQAKQNGLYLKQQLEKLPFTQVRGYGMMIGAEVAENAKEVHTKLFAEGYLCGLVGNTLRLLPPLIVTKEQIDAFISILGGIL